MMNQLVVLVNLIGLFIIDTFFLADISITQNVPATMEPGSEVRVMVTINKADLTGFAKLQLDLPEGLSATAIDTKGASFTFADGKAKFIWMALPTTPSFKISYTLSASSNAHGLLPIGGRLSYIENNERKSFEIPVVKVDLGTPGLARTVEEDPAAEDLVSAGKGAPVNRQRIAVIDDVAGKGPAQGPGGVSVQRTITPLNATEIQVEVSIKKSDLRGFGKLQENIPSGFTAMEQSSEEAIFTAQGQIVKFVWLNLPVRNELKVVYKLRSNGRPEGEYTIDGDFGYLLNDETQRVPIGASKFFIGPRAMEAIAQDEQSIKPEQQNDPKLDTKPKTEAPPQKKPDPVQPPKEKPQPVAEKPRTSTPIAGPEKGILFKVQISAAHKEVGKPYFVARHKYNGDFMIERHQGWIKYVTGRFPTYLEARDQRQAFVNAGHNFPGPFVTAYNDGERITVQEALLLSKQQWAQ
jgi:hypothetical protein